MKIATVQHEGSDEAWRRRDGRLAVVDDDAGRFVLASEDLAPDLWTALQHWDEVEPLLRALDESLRAGDEAAARPLHEGRFMAPLPRTTCWIDGSAYINHIMLVRKARGAAPPETLRTVPLMYQGVADPLLGPTDDIQVASEEHGIDFEGEVGVILDDVPMGTRAADAGQHIRLVCIMNDVSLRNLIPAELAAGFGFFHGKPPSSFAPFAVTPDELGDAWRDGRLHLPLRSILNGEHFGDPDAGQEMHFSFPQLIEHAATTRPLPAGTILGSGTVSNEDESRGGSCIAEKRMLEIIKTGTAMTPFMRFGDRIRIEVTDGQGRSVFGAIDQKVVRYEGT